MHTSSVGLVLKSKQALGIGVALVLASCSTVPDEPLTVKAEKPFAAAGSVDMQLDGGDYSVRAASDQRIRISFAGNSGNAVAELNTRGTQATLAIRNTPHNNFHATIEVPGTADLTVNLSGGNLQIAPIRGNKQIDSTGGNVEISIPNGDDYGSVEASVKAGNLDGGPFGNSSSGLFPHLKWSGPGKYRLRADLGAGNLEMKH
jgi:hypothetical protein